MAWWDWRAVGSVALAAVAVSACGTPNLAASSASKPIDRQEAASNDSTPQAPPPQGAVVRRAPAGGIAAATGGTRTVEGKSTATAAVFSVRDANPDREGAEDTPDYIEITAATVEVEDRRISMSINTAGELPARLTTSDEAALFAFDIDTPSSSYTLSAQVTQEGWSAQLMEGDRAVDVVEYELSGETVSFTFPAHLLGADTSSFSWTAATSLLRFEGTVASARGGDSAPTGSADLAEATPRRRRGAEKGRDR